MKHVHAILQTKKLRLKGAKPLVRDTNQELRKGGAKHSYTVHIPKLGLCGWVSKHNCPLQHRVPLRLVPHSFTFIGFTSDDRADAMSPGTGTQLGSCSGLTHLVVHPSTCRFPDSPPFLLIELFEFTLQLPSRQHHFSWGSRFCSGDLRTIQTNGLSQRNHSQST